MRLRVALQAWLLATGCSGANRRLRSLLAALARHAEAVEVLPLGGPGGLRGEVAVPIPAAPTWRRVAAERRSLPKIVRALGVDVLATATLPAPPDCGVPLCLTIHDLRDFGGFARGRLRRLLARAVLADAVARAAFVIVPSSFTRGEVLARHPGIAAKVRVVPNGVDARFFAARPEPAGSAGTRDEYLLHVGSLEPRKNIPMLLTAYASVARAGGAPPLRLAGWWSPPDEKTIARAIGVLGLGASVQLVGRVPEESLPGLYAGAALTLVPSLHEGFGLPALEAQAAGTPVIVSDRGALPEVVGEAGVVLAADDPSAWAREIGRLLRDDAERAHRARAGREWARRFTWDRTAELEIEAWQATAARGKG